MFIDMIVAETIARYQCFLNSYAAFMIDSKGITGKTFKDEVAEFSASYQHMLIQDKISKKYIHHMETFTVYCENPSKWDLLVMKALRGLTGNAAKKY